MEAGSSKTPHRPPSGFPEEARAEAARLWGRGRDGQDSEGPGARGTAQGSWAGLRSRQAPAQPREEASRGAEGRGDTLPTPAVCATGEAAVGAAGAQGAGVPAPPGGRRDRTSIPER